MFGHLQKKAHPRKRRAEADLRRLAIARAPKGRLGRSLRRVIPKGATYLNVGHSNLSDEVLGAWKRLKDTRVAVLVHDMIPLDHPEYQRPGTVARFEEKMRAVQSHADLVICNSAATESDVKRWFECWGRVPATIVAHLGLDLPVHETDAPPDGPSRFVTLGTIEPRKNHALLLDLWDSLSTELNPSDMPHLAIIGRRGWRNEAVFARLDAGPEFVQEASDLSDAQVARQVAGATALLFPSHAEGYGLPAIEALALGVPVICSDLPVFREVLGDSAIYLPVDDLYSWRRTILQVVSSRGQETAEQAERRDRFQPPTWDMHFNLVLKVV